MAQVTARKQWGKRIVATAVGGTAAAFAAPLVGAVISGGVVGMMLTGVTTGAIGSTVTKFTNNVIDADDIREVKYNPYRAEEASRNAIQDFLRSTLDPVFKSIRRNRKLDLDVTLEPDLEGSLQVLCVSATDASKLSIRIVMHVQPKAETQPRDLEDGVPPPALPVFQRDVEEVFCLPRESHTLLTGVPRSMFEGMLTGGLFSPLASFVPYLREFHFFKTVPKTDLGVSLGLPTGTGVIASALGLTRQPVQSETLASYVNFGAELNRQFLQVKECGELNGVDVSYNVRVKLEQSVNAEVNVVKGQDTKGGSKNSFEFMLSIN